MTRIRSAQAGSGLVSLATRRLRALAETAASKKRPQDVTVDLPQRVVRSCDDYLASTRGNSNPQVVAQRNRKEAERALAVAVIDALRLDYVQLRIMAE